MPDPRSTRTRWHRLDDILVITLCAVVCGADSFEEVERFGKAREGWLRTFPALPNGIPSHDTFNRVLAGVRGGARRVPGDRDGGGRSRPARGAVRDGDPQPRGVPEQDVP